MSQQAKKSEDGFFKTLFIAIICAVTIRSLLFEPFHIPSGSMKPNLLIGDYIFVNKFSYGYSRYSFPFGLNIFSGRMLQFNQPKRGDIAVFRLPSDPSINYVKRIIGLPGDTIEIKNGIVIVNGSELKQSDARDFSENQQKTQLTKIKEQISNQLTIDILNQETTAQDNTGIYVVPKDHYFFMGDNRDNSQDSRFLSVVGYVPYENLVGKVSLVFFSLDFNNFSWQNFIRFSRILHQPH